MLCFDSIKYYKSSESNLPLSYENPIQYIQLKSAKLDIILETFIANNLDTIEN
mgnify:CR=1 FL=1